MIEKAKFIRLKLHRAAGPGWLLTGLMLASLACALGGLDTEPPQTVIRIKNILPTLTPTAAAEFHIPANDAPATSGNTAVASAPTLPPLATPLTVADAPSQPANSLTVASVGPAGSKPGPARQTPGWSFAAIQTAFDQEEESVIMHGDMVNNTGMTQAIAYLTGTFFDNQGQMIAGEEDTDDYWPLQVVPPGGRVPFELTVYDIQSVADYNLAVVSQPSPETPRQDFEFLDLNSSTEAGNYCVTGKLRNPGGQLSDYLLVMAVIYDNQDTIINFDIYEENSPGDIVGEATLDFEICIDSFNQQVARHELRALGL